MKKVALLKKVAARDKSARLLIGMNELTKQAAMQKSADWKENFKAMLQGAGNWLKNPENQKKLAIGGAAGLGTYLASGLLPNANKYRGTRAIASTLAGLAGYSKGDEVVDWFQNKWNSITAPKAPAAKEPAADKAKGPRISEEDQAAASAQKVLEARKGSMLSPEQFAEHDRLYKSKDDIGGLYRSMVAGDKVSLTPKQQNDPAFLKTYLAAQSLAANARKHNSVLTAADQAASDTYEALVEAANREIKLSDARNAAAHAAEQAAWEGRIRAGDAELTARYKREVAAGEAGDARMQNLARTIAAAQAQVSAPKGWERFKRNWTPFGAKAVQPGDVAKDSQAAIARTISSLPAEDRAEAVYSLVAQQMEPIKAQLRSKRDAEITRAGNDPVRAAVIKGEYDKLYRAADERVRGNFATVLPQARLWDNLGNNTGSLSDEE